MASWNAPEPTRPGLDVDELRGAPGWVAVRAMPAAGGESVPIDLVSLFGLDGWADGEVMVGLGQATAADQQAAAGYFGTLPSVTVIGSGAFMDCSSLKAATISASASVASDAFPAITVLSRV